MDGLLHWDFNPGIAVEDQVCRRFKSTVHFPQDSSSKEFFLVVHFSSASFPLSCVSVGLALQCCIGGIASGLNVVDLGERSYRFRWHQIKLDTSSIPYGIGSGQTLYVTLVFSKIIGFLLAKALIVGMQTSVLRLFLHVHHQWLNPVSSSLNRVLPNDSSAHSELAKFGFYKKLQGNLLDKFNDSLDPGDAMAHNSSLIDKVHQSSPLSTQLLDPESSA